MSKHSDFIIPKRVWVNQPSKLQSHNKYHGKVGIAHTITNSLGNAFTTIYFTEGDLISMEINPHCLEIKNTKCNIFKFSKT